ncbi:EAL domain-containing protein [Metapseudomonas otitidis]|uniref:EAL domain-containing protein n=1 Tax=Metapseudomonas otitidis TaxID=319939 RepID=UPI0013F5D54B|nr:EAL domain-containing protein [Pseudomonas otitidis]
MSQSSDLACEFYDALNDGKLGLAFQPVVHSRNPHRVLYYEGLLRSLAEPFPCNPIALLERLGRIRLLDASVVSNVVRLLDRSPALTLGCNISALSAALDPGWEALTSLFQDRPELAGRLVIEITESARFGSHADALAFFRHFTLLGCKVAVDDLGAGCFTLDFVAEARPGIIKIDRSYLVEAREGGAALRRLEQVVETCRDISPVVVLEGIETLADHQLACAVNAEWLQGFLFGMPRVDHPDIPGNGSLKF